MQPPKEHIWLESHRLPTPNLKGHKLNCLQITFHAWLIPVLAYYLAIILNWKASVSTHHCRPRALSIGSLSMSRSSIFKSLALCSYEMACKTTWLLLIHSSNIKPLFSHKATRSCIILIATSSVATLFRQST